MIFGNACIRDLSASHGILVVPSTNTLSSFVIAKIFQTISQFFPFPEFHPIVDDFYIPSIAKYGYSYIFFFNVSVLIRSEHKYTFDIFHTKQRLVS
jgi:hypothetical protein